MKKTYRELQAELTAILDELQQGELDIDESIVKYEQGMKLVAELEKFLKTAEVKISTIKESMAE